MMRLGFPGWRCVGLAFGLGMIMATGQAPWNLWVLTLAALAVLLRRLSAVPPVSAGWQGWFAGAGYFAVALNWIVSPFLVDAATYGWMAPFALILMAFGLALFWAAAAFAARHWLKPLPGLVLTLTLADLARGYVLTGFPWALIGHVWIDTPTAQLAALTGPTGLTLLTLIIAALAATLRPLALASAAVIAAAAWGYGLWALSLPSPDAPAISLRLIQPNAPQDAKWDPDHAQMFFDRLMTATAAPGHPDLVIWPETSLPYPIEDGSALPAMIAEAGHGALVAVGVERIERGATDFRGFNSLQIYGPEGTLATYDKHHLVPFGEYIPLGNLAYDLFGIEAFAARTGHAYSAGPGPQIIDLGRLGHVLPLICYEAVFPQDLRTATRPDWILQITNDAWFGTTSGPFQHAAQARLRAIEQGLPLVRVANTGVTEVIDARGRVTASLPFGMQGSLDAALPGPLAATPYARYGEIPLILLLAGLLPLTIRHRRIPSA